MTQPGGGRAVLARDAAIACGLPVGNTAIEVRSETGAVCGDEEIGRIFVNGGGVASGYLKAGDIAAFSDDGWLDTDDIEACAREAIGEAGLVCAAFGTIGRGGRQASTLVIERANAANAGDTLCAAVAGSVTAEVAIKCDVHFVGRRALPRTSSGKISRAAAKTAYLDGSLARL